MSVKPSIYDLAQHGEVLATRDMGREAGRQAADELATVEALVLGFWGVEVASPPFLDELMRALRTVLLGGDSRRLLIVSGLNEDVRECMEMVLDRQGSSIAELSAGQTRLLGGSRELRKTLEEAQELGYFTAPQLAERLEIKLPNLHARLKQLTEAGAIAQADPPPRQDGPGRAASGFQAPDMAVLAACQR